MLSTHMIVWGEKPLFYDECNVKMMDIMLLLCWIMQQIYLGNAAGSLSMAFHLHTVLLADPRPPVPHTTDPDFCHELQVEHRMGSNQLLQQRCQLPIDAPQNTEGCEHQNAPKIPFLLVGQVVLQQATR